MSESSELLRPSVDELLDINDLARIYRVKVPTIRKWLREDRIPNGFILGGRLMRWHPDTIRDDLKAKAEAVKPLAQAVGQ